MGTSRPKRMKKHTQQAPSTSNNQKYLITGIVIVLVIALFGLLILSLRDPELLPGLQRVSGLSRSHNDNATYANTGLPPMGGEHANVWQNCGIYDQPINSANAVHSLEHGAVWLTYSPDLSASDVDKLRGYVRGEPYVVMSPFTGQQSKVVLTAWGLQMEVNDVGDNSIAEFVNRYQQGSQTPEPGATCRDGIGTPLQ